MDYCRSVFAISSSFGNDTMLQDLQVVSRLLMLPVEHISRLERFTLLSLNTDRPIESTCKLISHSLGIKTRCSRQVRPVASSFRENSAACPRSHDHMKLSVM